MKREDYVVVFIGKKRNISDRAFCHVCRPAVAILGESCPHSSSQCSYENSSNPVRFNNSIHDIIATKEYCNGRLMGCKRDCGPCVLPNTFHVEIK